MISSTTPDNVQTRNGTVIITGATDGIGLELARLYQERGRKLLLIGRRAQEDLADPVFEQAQYCQLDLAQPDCGDRLTARLEELGTTDVSLLIHNAGVGYLGDVEKQTSLEITDLLAVNLRAPVTLTHGLIPFMQGKGRRQIVFVSSVVSALPCPDFAVYAASKSALDGFARSLEIELAGNIDVQVVHPGATRTAMHAKVGLDPEVSERFTSARDTARAIVESVDAGRSGGVGLPARMLRATGRHLAIPLDGLLRWRRR